MGGRQNYTIIEVLRTFLTYRIFLINVAIKEGTGCHKALNLFKIIRNSEYQQDSKTHRILQVAHSVPYGRWFGRVLTV
jgi:hypothetical protein